MQTGIVQPAAPIEYGAAAAYEKFRAEHVDTWSGRFACEVIVQAREPFYRAAGAVLAAFAGE